MNHSIAHPIAYQAVKFELDDTKFWSQLLLQFGMVEDLYKCSNHIHNNGILYSNACKFLYLLRQFYNSTISTIMSIVFLLDLQRIYLEIVDHTIDIFHLI